MQPLQPIRSNESPRDILATDFQLTLPISGGWGYSQADACIIDNINDPAFNAVAVEYNFVEKRIYEEMIIFRPKAEQFAGIEWKLQEQELLRKGGKSFDKLRFNITAYPVKDWEELRAAWEGPQGYGHPDFDIEAHEKKDQEKIMRFTREFWFDITSFMDAD